jgi:hypothetical protein
LPFSRFESAQQPADRWYLASPTTSHGEYIDPRLFTQGKRIDMADGLYLAKRREGKPLDFTLADFDMPVVSDRLAALLLQHAKHHIQFIPVSVHGESSRYQILNVCANVSCIAEPETVVTRWGPDDGRPDKIGQLRMVISPVMTADEYDGQAIFRATGWQIMLLCHRGLASALISSGFSGLALSALPSRPNRS